MTHSSIVILQIHKIKENKKNILIFESLTQITFNGDEAIPRNC